MNVDLARIYEFTSSDGLQWKRAAKLVLNLPDRYMIYYAPRDWRNTYVLPGGGVDRDGAGVYSHIGLAVIEK